MSKHMGRIRWKCRRGMLELDMVLLRFVDQQYEKLDEAQSQVFERLLEESDPTLFSWFLERVKPEDKDYQAMVKLILASSNVGD